MTYAYTKYADKEVEIVDATVVKNGSRGKDDVLVFTTKSGHKIHTKFFKQEHVELRGKQSLNLTNHVAFGWMVDFGMPGNRLTREDQYK